jgi:serine kinase of HPr protein (carbohydrate metabolism regulator)
LPDEQVTMALELTRKNFTPFAPKKGEEYMNARMRSHFRKMLEQLKAELSEEILGVTVRKVVIPVAAGRNLAVLLEAAVRNYILQLRGIDSMAVFVKRQKREIDSGP